MNNIPTAKEFLNKGRDCKFYDFANLGYCDKCKSTNLFHAVDCSNEQCIPKNGTKMLSEDKLIEFAKLHAQAALQSAANKAEIETVYSNPYNPSMGIDDVIVNKDSILNAYPLDLIK